VNWLLWVPVITCFGGDNNLEGDGKVVDDADVDEVEVDVGGEVDDGDVLAFLP
jgi:hypothetical protein